MTDERLKEIESSPQLKCGTSQERLQVISITALNNDYKYRELRDIITEELLPLIYRFDYHNQNLEITIHRLRSDLSHLQSHFDSQALEMERLKVESDTAVDLLRQILPMQGCVQCQEVFMPCHHHGDISKTTYEIEQFLESLHPKAEGKEEKRG